MDIRALKGWGMAGTLALVLTVGCVQQKSIAWHTAYDAALADAGKSGRPILLDFYTDW